jgi:hypothetical protein
MKEINELFKRGEEKEKCRAKVVHLPILYFLVFVR